MTKKSKLQILREAKGISQGSLAGRCANLLTLKRYGSHRGKYIGYNDWGRIMDVENGAHFDEFVKDGTAARCAEILECSIDDLRDTDDE